MRTFSKLQMIAHLLTKDETGKFATSYVHMISYIAIAGILGMVLIGDNLDGFLSAIRRTLFGTSYG